MVDGQVGPVFLLRSRSKAVGHAWKPMARVGVRTTLRPRLEVGGTVSGLLDGSEHYRVLGLLAHGRFALLQRPGFSLGASLALGAGYDADILHADLEGDSVVPYGFFAVDGRWELGRRWLLGVEAGWENVSILRLGLLVGIRLGDPVVSRR